MSSLTDLVYKTQNHVVSQWKQITHALIMRITFYQTTYYTQRLLVHLPNWNTSNNK